MRTPPKLKAPEYPFQRIAFAGPMCSGKTTLANELVSAYSYNLLSFAGPLKELAEELYGPIVKNNEGRKMLQEFSDDLKKWDPNLFITQILRQIEGYDKAITKRVVIDDLRYVAEYEALKQAGFIIIGANCLEIVRLQRISTLYPDTTISRLMHPSETEYQKMKMDYFINTTIDGSMEICELVESFIK